MGLYVFHVGLLLKDHKICFLLCIEIEIKMHQYSKWIIIQWLSVDIFLNQLLTSLFQISEVDLELTFLFIVNKMKYEFIEPYFCTAIVTVTLLLNHKC